MVSKVSLELDDAHVGWLVAREGARVDVEPWIRRKEGEALVHPTPAFWDWALGSLYGERRRGALLAFDAEGRELERLVFAGATIAELGTPRVGWALGATGALALRVRVGAAEVVAGGSASAHGRAEPTPIAGCRLWLAGEAPSLHAIEAIGSLGVKIHPSRATTQRMVVTLVRAGEVDVWADAEALVGRAARLEYLAADATEVIAGLEFKVAGASVGAEEVDASGTRRARVELVGKGLCFASPGQGASVGR